MANPKKALGTALENRVVERARDKGLDASKQPGSGVYRDFPNDVVVEDILVECKVRSVELDAAGKRYLKIDLDWLRGVQENAERGGFESAVLVVNAKYSNAPLVLHNLDFFLELLKGKRNG